MKNKILINGFAGIAALGLLSSSCASDYLEVAPITLIATNTVTSTEQTAIATYYGVIEYMYTQLSAWGPPYFIGNGEPWLNIFYGDAHGADNLVWLYDAVGLGTYILNWDGMTYGDYWMAQPGWIYCYTLISSSNNFLVGIDNCDGDPAVVAYIKAGVLCVRAHAYTKLLQLYGPRWEDSNNGEELVCVLRLPTVDGAVPTGDSPLVSMNVILDQIYADLNEAIALFEGPGAAQQRGSSLWEPDLSVAQGLLARAAAIKHDWKLCQEMAGKARTGYAIMSKEQCKEGFARANQEYMWTNIDSDFVYYWAHGSAYACNGPYPGSWGNLGAGMINYELYKQIPEGDVRRDYYWTPDKRLFPGLSKNNFWNDRYIDQGTMDMNGLNQAMKTSLQSMGNSARPNESWPEAYTDHDGTLGPNEHVVIQFGSQYKFWTYDSYGTNQFPFMRASEMLLLEAEAAVENGDATTAQNNLFELNSKRNDNYTKSSATGTALRDEVRLYRRIELWGEGFNFFDLKRWNVPMERKPWIMDDPESNNIPARYAVTREPADMNGWRFAIPRAEYQYNSMIKADSYESQPEPETQALPRRR